MDMSTVKKRLGDWKKALGAWLQENLLAVSSLGSFFAIALALLGIMGIFYDQESWAPKTLLDLIGDYDIWVLFAGVVLGAIAGYYLWLTRHHMARFEELINTKSKAQFQRHWMELEQIARYHLTEEYRRRVARLRQKFGLK